MKQTVLISGIKGFLASNLATLLKDDYEVYGIGQTSEIFNGIEVFASKEINNINIEPDYLVLCHAAVASGNFSPSKEELFEVNVNVTKSIFERFAKAKVIYISTASIYDANTNVIEEKSPDNPQNDYAKSKLFAEKLVLKSKNAVVFRMSSLYGIGMKENTIIPNYINQALQNNSIEVWGTGERNQNYIFVEDACRYIKNAIEKFDALKNNVLLCVDKKEVTNLELAQIIAQNTNSNISFVNEDFSKSLHYNNSLTCKLLNWEPKSNFEAEIQNYITWKKEQF